MAPLPERELGSFVIPILANTVHIVKRNKEINHQLKAEKYMTQICCKCKKIGWNYIVVAYKTWMCWKCFRKEYPIKEERLKVVNNQLLNINQYERK